MNDLDTIRKYVEKMLRGRHDYLLSSGIYDEKGELVRSYIHTDLHKLRIDRDFKFTLTIRRGGYWRRLQVFLLNWVMRPKIKIKCI